MTEKGILPFGKPITARQMYIAAVINGLMSAGEDHNLTMEGLTQYAVTIADNLVAEEERKDNENQNH